MFAEDVELLPKRGFVDLLESLQDSPAQFAPLGGRAVARDGRGQLLGCT
jgi:hypothetical protein